MSATVAARPGDIVPPLYAVDTTNVKSWQNNVYEPACSIVEVGMIYGTINYVVNTYPGVSVRCFFMTTVSCILVSGQPLLQKNPIVTQGANHL